MSRRPGPGEPEPHQRTITEKRCGRLAHRPMERLPLGGSIDLTRRARVPPVLPYFSRASTSASVRPFPALRLLRDRSMIFIKAGLIDSAASSGSIPSSVTSAANGFPFRVRRTGFLLRPRA